jgi:dissimilatory sulfite reductase (desulfoviridin) alpha/beta subunit
MATLTVNAVDEKRVKAMGFLSNKGTDNFSGRVITVNGKITGDQMKCIGEAAKLFGNGNVTFTTRLTVEVQGIPYEKIDDFRTYIGKAGLTTGGTGAKIRPVVSCKGTTCQYGLIDTFELSEEIHRRFFEGYRQVKLPHKFKIAVGGCPNNCVKPDLNDLGIIGQKQPSLNKQVCRGCKKCAVEAVCPVKAAKVSDGKLKIDTEICTKCGRCRGKCYFNAMTYSPNGYRICIGGRWGKQISMSKSLGKMFTDKAEVLNTVEKAILFYRENGKPGERFAQTIERIGFDNVEKELLSDEILNRKEQILNEE